MLQNLNFGYPQTCTKCIDADSCNEKSLQLQVSPFYKSGSDIRLMLIGQDPTIYKDTQRVKQVLMLDEKNSQLRRWLEGIFGFENFQSVTIYATNLVKCTFRKPPATYDDSKFLHPYFDNCRVHLQQEVKSFRPTLVFTFGEPTHFLFCSLLNKGGVIPREMKNSFKGDFYDVDIDGVKFKYSPCLHITTFRVAETYGDKVRLFKDNVKSLF